MVARSREPRRSHFFRNAFLFLLLGCLGWAAWVNWQIKRTGENDEARGADAIAVFGAAQYLGHPSPVFHARLEHAVTLYNRQIAPLVITLGGSGDHSTESEGAVGRDYLLAKGIPYDHIIAETRSLDTEQQAESLAAYAHKLHLSRIVVVSDASHLFRIRALCRDQGLDVMTSPRPAFGNISTWDSITRTAHEIVSYTSIRFHLHASWLHRWLEGREE